MRTARRIIYAVLFALLGAVLCLFLVTGLLSSGSDFFWNVTTLGRLILSSSLGLLMVSSAVAQAWKPRPGLTTIAAVLALVDVLLLALGGGSVGLVCLVIVGGGIVCLEVGSLVGNLRTRSDQAAESGVLLGITAVMIIVGLLLVGALVTLPELGSIATTTSFVYSESPYGTWTVTGDEIDEGALGGSVSFSVYREYAGLVERGRVIYSGDWGSRPKIRWADPRTMIINGRELDVYRDPPIDGYE